MIFLNYPIILAEALYHFSHSYEGSAIHYIILSAAPCLALLVSSNHFNK
jgi:hypothetical protein